MALLGDMIMTMFGKITATIGGAMLMLITSAGFAAEGTVKFFNPAKGFGFIAPNGGGKDVFVHITALERAGIRDLKEGQKVSYEVVTDRRGKEAADNIQLID